MIGPTPENLASLFFISVVFILFGIHAVRAWRDWRGHRDSVSLRGALLAICIAVSLAAIFTASLYRAGFLPLNVTLFTGYMVRGTLIVGGVVLVVSGIRDRRPR